MRKRQTPWAVLDPEDGGLLCRRCGRTWKPALPMRAAAFCAYVKAFLLEHRDCEEKTE